MCDERCKAIERKSDSNKENEGLAQNEESGKDPDEYQETSQNEIKMARIENDDVERKTRKCYENENEIQANQRNAIADFEVTEKRNASGKLVDLEEQVICK